MSALYSLIPTLYKTFVDEPDRVLSICCEVSRLFYLFYMHDAYPFKLHEGGTSARGQSLSNFKKTIHLAFLFLPTVSSSSESEGSWARRASF